MHLYCLFVFFHNTHYRVNPNCHYPIIYKIAFIVARRIIETIVGDCDVSTIRVRMYCTPIFLKKKQMATLLYYLFFKRIHLFGCLQTESKEPGENAHGLFLNTNAPRM